MIAAVVSHADCKQIVLSGGCFQNVRLLTAAVERLRLNGYRAYWPQQVPPNDGGLALGQCYGVALALDRGS
jgi:hydrogenase maturation protein HypF